LIIRILSILIKDDEQFLSEHCYLVKVNGLLKLRKLLKIKASLLITAWLLLFAHDVIPHNHVYDHAHSCVHHKYAGDEYRIMHHLSFKDSGTGSDKHICRISNLLFHTLHPELIFAELSRDFSFGPSDTACELINKNSDLRKFCNLRGTSLLRAPPLS